MRTLRSLDPLVRAFGWRGLLYHGDTAVTDRFKWIRRHLLPGRLRTLDAGTGNGVFAIYAATIGNDVLGLTFDSAEVEKASRRAARMDVPGLRFEVHDLRALGPSVERLGTFDQILCLETIEHIRGDRRLIAALAALLNPNGRLLLTTPSAEHRPLYGESVSPTEDGGHVRWGYSHEELRDLLRTAGLEVLTEGFVTGLVSQGAMNLKYRVGPRSEVLGWLA